MLPRAHSRDGAVYLVLDPVRVVAFNTADGWMRDVTADIARELRSTATSPATTQAARRLKGTARPQAGPGDEPSLVRHARARRMSVA
jgi:hypothetical protein